VRENYLALYLRGVGGGGGDKLKNIPGKQKAKHVLNASMHSRAYFKYAQGAFLYDSSLLRFIP